MPYVVPAEGEAQILRRVTSAPITVCLFVNDVKLTRELKSSDLKEARGFGYAPVTLEPGGWMFVEGVASHPPVAIEFTGPIGLVYGYALKQNGVLLVAHRFPDEPIKIRFKGDSIKVTPILRHKRPAAGK